MKKNLIPVEEYKHKKTTLKPCPFCKNNNAYIVKQNDGYYPTCGECPCALLNLYNSEAEAIEAWNRRADK